MNYPFPDQELKAGPFGSPLLDKGITTFHEACTYVRSLPYQRITDRDDNLLVIREGRGTCSSKHGFLAALAEEHGMSDLHLIAGVFLMNPDTHPVLENFFEDKNYKSIPEMHCYFRYGDERIDLTSESDLMPVIRNRLVREQRIEPHQTGSWKEKIHKHYLEAWLERNPQLEMTIDRIWNDREACIRILSGRL